jgi:hypothetical protein
VSVEGVSPFLFLLQPSLLSTKHGVFAYFLSVYIERGVPFVSVEGVSPFLFLLQPSLLSTKHGVFAYFLSVYIYMFVYSGV